MFGHWMTDPGLIGEDSGVTNGSSCRDGVDRSLRGLRGEKGGSRAEGRFGNGEGWKDLGLGGSGGGNDTLGVAGVTD